MGFAFERRAVPRKARRGLRALFTSAPEPREIRDRLTRLLPRLWKTADVTSSTKRVSITVHPFARPLRVTVVDDGANQGAIEVRGDASSVGPGLCDHVTARMAPVLDELDYVWEDASDPRADALAWLAEELRAGNRRIGIPKNRMFFVDAAVQTPLGPRNAAWRDAVLADPAAGRDAFAWWDDAPGQAQRSRALLAMWHEIAWREPLDKAEMAALKRVDADLTSAREADDAIALPYAEWAEIVDHLGEAKRAAELRSRAKGASTIGYRRFDMDVEVGDDWALTLPGAFVGRWDEDGGRYWATDGDRTIELMTLETDQTDSAALLEVAAPRHPILERTADGNRHARAEAYDEGDTHIVHGLVAIAPRVAILTCKGNQRDEPWALATWRSLRSVPAAEDATDE